MRHFIVLSAVLLISACAGQAIGPVQLTPAKPDSGAYAKVYLMRPGTERMMGFADNPLDVDANDKPLVRLAKAEYTLVTLPPGRVQLTAHNQTSFGPSHKIKKISRTRTVTLVEGQTYYIILRPIDGEFRGAYFMPEQLEFAEARVVAASLRATGPARTAPIPSLPQQ
ncbi:MAG: hypothetical protein HY940_06040 [Gammaproteobacteria bacterium]|nr:hypothetical protein [Gammaproteobacteria bacterium]